MMMMMMMMMMMITGHVRIWHSVSAGSWGLVLPEPPHEAPRIPHEPCPHSHFAKFESPRASNLTESLWGQGSWGIRGASWGAFRGGQVPTSRQKENAQSGHGQSSPFSVLFSALRPTGRLRFPTGLVPTGLRSDLRPVGLKFGRMPVGTRLMTTTETICA